MRSLARKILLAIARAAGTTIRDAETGRPLGRAFVIGWRGRVYVIGLDATVRAVFLPQRRMTFWKQEIGFIAAPAPDFPDERRP